MMRSQKTMMVLLSLALNLVLVAPPVKAEPKVTITPSNLTVVGTKCPVFFDCPVLKRRLVLQTNQAIANLQILSLDLDRTDGTTVLQGSAINPILSTTSVEPNQPLTIPVEFNLNDAKSGEFSGVLLAIHSDGQLVIPIIVRVKDHWLGAIFLLLLGVMVSIGMSAYRTDGRNRDEIVVLVSRIRTQMKADPELVESFQKKINRYLIDVETDLTNKRWDEAKQAVAKAQTTWDKWRKSREDWLALSKFESSLTDRLKDLTPDAPYVQTIGSYLENIERQTADKENPEQLRKELNDLQQQLFSYLRGEAKLDKFDTLRNELTGSAQQEQELRELSQYLQQELNNLSPTELEAFPRWEQEIDNELKQLDQAIKQQISNNEAQSNLSITSRGVSSTYPARLPNPVPDVQPLQINPVGSARNLFLFQLLSYTIAIFLLAGAGFRQLYVTQPTFGANLWTDYFALLAWGFGAEATRDAVTKTIREWKLPGLK
ncbi:MAG: hypothetical protein MGG37_01530 [Trichodesmium sp. MAG_R01]|nr:hypothetical protein [Trichodesmium sp. MAG_R01]